MRAFDVAQRQRQVGVPQHRGIDVAADKGRAHAGRALVGLDEHVLTCFLARAVIDEFSIASIGMPCEGVYCSSATLLPARSSIFCTAASRDDHGVAALRVVDDHDGLARHGPSCAGWAAPAPRSPTCARRIAPSWLRTTVVSVGMSSLMTNSTFKPSLAKIEPGCGLQAVAVGHQRRRVAVKADQADLQRIAGAAETARAGGCFRRGNRRRRRGLGFGRLSARRLHHRGVTAAFGQPFLQKKVPADRCQRAQADEHHEHLGQWTRTVFHCFASP